MHAPSSDRLAPLRVALGAGELAARADALTGALRNCRLCPRACGVDRTRGELGFCGIGEKPVVASWGPHFGEEPPLVGRGGSGTIFFTGCNLGCVYCQNWSISHGREGREVSIEKLADIMLTLQEDGCHNINAVTPTHQVPMLLRALDLATGKGLRLPLVYNSGGYEALGTLRALDGVVDIYMPDMKYADPKAARVLSEAEDYPRVARAALLEMHRQVGDLVMDQRGVALRGLLVRHLVLPAGLAGTEEVLRFVAEEISRDTYMNIMDQYQPCFRAFAHPPLDRRITGEEYREALRLAEKYGLHRLA
ncbi:MAG: radical SAM protein [Nitrospirota bacterium]